MINILTVSRISLVAILLLLTASCNNKESDQSITQNALPMDTLKSEHVTLINSFEVPIGKLEESIKYWEACRDFLRNEPGYVSTKLHQSIKGDARFQLVNVAVWETPQAFTDASKKMSKELGIPPTDGLKPNPALYTIIRE